MPTDLAPGKVSAPPVLLRCGLLCPQVLLALCTQSKCCVVCRAVLCAACVVPSRLYSPIRDRALRLSALPVPSRRSSLCPIPLPHRAVHPRVSVRLRGNRPGLVELCRHYHRVTAMRVCLPRPLRGPGGCRHWTACHGKLRKNKGDCRSTVFWKENDRAPGVSRPPTTAAALRHQPRVSWHVTLS